MKRQTLISCCFVVALTVLMQDDLLAQTTSDFASADFLDQSQKIQNFLFGPAMRIAGVLGGAYGLMQAILSSSLKPLVIYGGIGLAVNIVPKFIDGVFNVSGMLLSF